MYVDQTKYDKYSFNGTNETIAKCKETLLSAAIKKYMRKKKKFKRLLDIPSGSGRLI